jgi:hypothetical protein
VVEAAILAEVGPVCTGRRLLWCLVQGYPMVSDAYRVTNVYCVDPPPAASDLQRYRDCRSLCQSPVSRPATREDGVHRAKAADGVGRLSSRVIVVHVCRGDAGAALAGTIPTCLPDIQLWQLPSPAFTEELLEISSLQSYSFAVSKTGVDVHV